MFRLTKALWFFTVLIAIGSLLYVFASLPDIVNYGLNSGNATLERDTFFYMVLALIAISDTIIYALAKWLEAKSYANKKLFMGMATLSYGVGGAFNVFFAVAIHFIGLFNSGESFNYDNFGFLVYLSVGLMVILLLSVPVVMLKNKPSS